MLLTNFVRRTSLGRLFILQTTDKKIIKRINILIKDIQRNPFKGIGNPELLKYNWSGF
jgi:Txe/YoeB family toxin of Txe-Axe toxin-antitoxin module